MSGTWSVLLVCVLAGCGRVGFDAPALGNPDGGTGRDGATTFGPWSPVDTLTNAGSASEDEEDISFSSDLREAYFGVGPDDGTNPKVLRTMSRPNENAPWGSDSELVIANQAQWSTGPRLSPDDLTLYFNTTASGGPGGQNIFRVTRTAVGGAWTNPQPVVEVNDDDDEQWFAPCNGGRYVMARSGSNSHFSLYEGILGTSVAPQISSLEDAAANESGPFLTADCLTLYFSSDINGDGDLFITRRATPTSPWDPPTALDEFNTADSEGDPFLSADGRLFAFSSNRNGTDDVFFATR